MGLCKRSALRRICIEEFMPTNSTFREMRAQVKALPCKTANHWGQSAVCNARLSGSHSEENNENAI